MKIRLRTISLLGILAILVLMGEFFYTTVVGMQDFQDGYNEGYEAASNGETLMEHTSIFLDVRSHDTMQPDSLTCSPTNKKIPYHISGIRTYYKASAISMIVFWLAGVASLATLYGICCLFGLLLNVSRGQIFTPRNVRRLRIFSYSMTLMVLLVQIHRWMAYAEATRQITLLGYDFVLPMDGDWTSCIIILLLTELFAVGVKMKQDQDLTI